MCSRLEYSKKLIPLYFSFKFGTALVSFGFEWIGSRVPFTHTMLRKILLKLIIDSTVRQMRT